MREKGPDEVFCRSCGEPIERAAELCPNCGVRNQEAARSAGSASTAPRPHDPADYETTVSEAWYVAVVPGTVYLYRRHEALGVP